MSHGSAARTATSCTPDGLHDLGDRGEGQAPPGPAGGVGCHIVGDDLGIFCHGRAEFIDPATHPDFPEIEEHLVGHYGSSPRSWGPDIVYLRVQPHWMVSYAFAKDRLLADAD